MLHRATRSIAMGALLVSALSACLPGLPFSQGPSDAELQRIRSIDGGECFDRATDGDIDPDQQVPCTQEHDFEVLAAIPLPDEIGNVAYEDATTIGGEASQRIREYAAPLCEAAMVEWSGLQDTVGALSGFGVEPGLRPAVNGNLGFMGPREALWDVYPVLLCTFEWVELTGAAIKVTSGSDEPALASFGTADTAANLRVCANLDETSAYLQVACSGPHAVEMLFTFDAEHVLGADWVSGVDITALTDQDWADVDAPCSAAASTVFGAERTLQDVTIRAEVSPQRWGVPVLGSGSYPVVCIAYTTDPKMVLNGTVWGLGDNPAILVPAA